ncbi:alpha/beta fold hydrolase [Streptomyces sp. NPDC058256]|uniref:alpha/beta fold hydrolase n=1 Tax=Streptomyces sp. NPDC058256 TaxID=3346408 RepID=UPI0036E57F2C
MNPPGVNALGVRRTRAGGHECDRPDARAPCRGCPRQPLARHQPQADHRPAFGVAMAIETAVTGPAPHEHDVRPTISLHRQAEHARRSGRGRADRPNNLVVPRRGAMRQLERTTVVTDDGAHLAVYTEGDPSASVTAILSHGFLMTADTWRRQARHLTARGYRVVRYDQRAHGHSTPGNAITTVERLGVDLAHVIAAANPIGPIVLAGHSLGGMTLLALAAGQPQLILDHRPRVALVSTSCTRANFAPGNRPLNWAKGISRAMYAYPTCWLPSTADRLRRRLPPDHLWALRPDRVRHTGTPPPCREAIHGTHTEPIADLWRSLREYDTTDALHALASLADHVEILTGECDDMIPLSKTRQLARELPLARLHTPVPQARHRLPADKYGHAVVTAVLGRMCEASLHGHAPIGISGVRGC